MCTTLATRPLRTYLDRCTTYLSSRPANATDLSAQDFATPTKVLSVHDDFKGGVVAEVTEWEARLMTYLQDEETVKVLIPPVQVSALSPSNGHVPLALLNV